MPVNNPSDPSDLPVTEEPSQEPDPAPGSDMPNQSRVLPVFQAEENTTIQPAFLPEEPDPEGPMPRKPLAWVHTPVVIFVGLFFSLVGSILVWLAFIDISHGLFWVILPLQSFGQFAALWVISRVRARKNLAKDFGFSVEPRHMWWLIAGGVALIALGYLASVLRSVLGLDEGNPQGLIDAAEDIRGSASVVAAFISIAVLGPVVEELTFRGLTLRTALSKGLSPFWAVVTSSAIFAVVHLADPSLFSLEGLVVLVMFFLLGLFLGFVTLRTGTLGPAIFAHSGFNLVSLLIVFWITIE